MHDYTFLVQEDHNEAIQRELGVEFAKDDEEDEEEHPGVLHVLSCALGFAWQPVMHGK